LVKLDFHHRNQEKNIVYKKIKHQLMASLRGATVENFHNDREFIEGRYR